MNNYKKQKLLKLLREYRKQKILQQSETFEYANQLRKLLDYIEVQYNEKLMHKIVVGKMYKGSKYLLGIDYCSINYFSLRTGHDSYKTRYNLQRVISDKSNDKYIKLMINGDVPYNERILSKKQYNLKTVYTIFKKYNRLDLYYKNNVDADIKFKLIYKLSNLSNIIHNFYADSVIIIRIDNDKIRIENMDDTIKDTFSSGLNKIYLEVDNIVKKLQKQIDIIDNTYKEIDKFIEDHNLEQFIKEINQGMQ